MEAGVELPDSWEIIEFQGGRNRWENISTNMSSCGKYHYIPYMYPAHSFALCHNTVQGDLDCFETQQSIT